MTANRAERPPKTAMLVALRIVHAIRSSGLRRGDRLPSEHHMLESYGVGRGTLREALRILEVQNVISLKPGPGGGPVVQKPEADTLAASLSLVLEFDDVSYGEIQEVRQGIEPHAAELAAERLSDIELAAIRSAADTIGRSIAEPQGFRRASNEFHTALACGSGNKVYGFLVPALIAIRDTIAAPTEFAKTWRVQQSTAAAGIVTALELRDRAAAGDAMRSLLVAEYDHFAQNRPEVLERTVTWAP